MPRYDYRCRDCFCQFESFSYINERYQKKCPECQSEFIEILLTTCNYQAFEPYDDPYLGVRITGREHKKQVVKGMGLTNVGDASFDEVERQAASNKRERKKAEDETPLPQDFLDSYYKAKAMYPDGPDGED